MKRHIYSVAVLLAIVTLVVVLRAPALPQSVIDWDESVYLLMARSLLSGHAPYTVVWDHKPPGLYALFAAALAVMGQPVVAMRLLGMAAVVATCVLLALAGRRMMHNDLAGVVAALAYAVASNRNGGMATNTEILFAPWTTAALLLLAGPALSGRFPSPRRWLAAGLLFGIALQIKTAAGFELLAASALLAMSAPRGRGRAAAAAALLAGAALPTALAMLAFAAAGHWREYVYATITANARYLAATPALTPATIIAALRQQLRTTPTLWAAAPLAAVTLLSRRVMLPAPRRLLGLLLIWLASTLLAVLMARRFFSHYFLQCLPPLALLLGWSVACGPRILLRSPAPRAALSTALIALLVLLPAALSLRHTASEVRNILNSPGRVDGLAYTGAVLRRAMQPGDTLFVADGQPVLYVLAGVEAPTPYVLPAWLYNPDLAAMLPVDATQELTRILHNAPRYVITRDGPLPSTPYFTTLAATLAQDYELERVIQGQRLYRRVR